MGCHTPIRDRYGPDKLVASVELSSSGRGAPYALIAKNVSSGSLSLCCARGRWDKGHSLLPLRTKFLDNKHLANSAGRRKKLHLAPQIVGLQRRIRLITDTPFFDLNLRIRFSTRGKPELLRGVWFMRPSATVGCPSAGAHLDS